MNLIKNILKLFLFIVCINFTSCKAPYPELTDGIYAEFVTSKGIMVAKLEKEKTPVTVANFVALAEGTNTLVKKQYKSKKYYDGTIFHRVINDFMIQGGDPTGTGTGNPGYKFMDEFNENLKHNKPGILSMANSGPNSNGSQFFITEAPKPHLDEVHTVFGELIIGLDILDSISNVETNAESKPLTKITLEHLNIIRKGKEAKAFDAPKIFEEHFAIQEKIEKEKIEKAEALLKATKDKFEAQKAKSTTLESGLQFYVSKKGNGEKLTTDSEALLDYTLYFKNGKIIETSKLDIAETFNIVNKRRKLANKYEPIIASLSPDARMIPGFKEGLLHLNVGDKATLFIPYHLAYGDSGTRGIPGKTDIIFEIEIQDLLK